MLCGGERGVGISVSIVSGNVILTSESVWTKTSWWLMITLRRLSRWSTVPSTRFCWVSRVLILIFETTARAVALSAAISS